MVLKSHKVLDKRIFFDSFEDPIRLGRNAWLGQAATEIASATPSHFQPNRLENHIIAKIVVFLEF